MRVEIERDSDLAMPQPLARDLGMNAGREHVRRVAVAKIVEANPLQAASGEEIRKDARQCVRLERGSVRLHDDVVIIGQPDAELQ